MSILMFGYARVGNLLKLSMFITHLLPPSYAANFFQDVSITWGGSRAQIQNGGQVLSLSLDISSGSGFESNNQFLLGRFDMQLKLIQGDSAGTVTSFFLSSQGSAHDEVDYEFLGNSSGEPYTMQTNIYTQGVGNKEQRIRLWFDPTFAFHNYTVLWNSKNILFMVDNTPVRVFTNYESEGIPFPSNQAMRVYGSLWDAEDWATQGGLVKTDWSKAPFTSYYSNYNANGCVLGNSCNGNQEWKSQTLDANGRNKLQWVQKNYMIYNYCTDVRRFPQGLPPECKFQAF